jgi:hypothetical protein
MVSFGESVTNELVLALPNYLQSEFLQSASVLDFQHCAQLLSFTVYGDCNIFGHPRQFTSNVDLIQCVYRFFINMVPEMHADGLKQRQLLLALCESKKSLIAQNVSRPLRVLLNLRFALMILSTANQNAHLYVDSLPLLRAAFVEALEAPAVPEIDDGKKLPVIYWVCLLWASLMEKMGRTQEAAAVLTGTLEELTAYSTGHPGCRMTRQQLFICVSHLCAAMPENQDSYKARLSTMSDL